MFWFKQAAEAGHATASYQYGYYLTKHLNIDNARLSEAEQYIASAARNKIADALVYVGNVSLDGSARFPKNEAYAREVYEEAAEQGHATALAQLGAMNAQGAGGAVDNEAAARYTLAAAKAGIPIGQFNMFAMYVKGIGVPKDAEEGIRYLKEAAAQGYRRHSDEFKLAVVTQSLLPNASVSRIAREHKHQRQPSVRLAQTVWRRSAGAQRDGVCVAAGGSHGMVHECPLSVSLFHFTWACLLGRNVLHGDSSGRRR